jgi:hypothetical protein
MNNGKKKKIKKYTLLFMKYNLKKNKYYIYR